MFAGGYSGTDGIIHTGIGPFDMDTASALGYGTMRYTRGALKFNFFTNILNGDATGLLAIGTDGKPILFEFNTKTYDFEVGNINTHRHAQRAQLRRQRPLQQLRPVDRAGRRQPHRSSAPTCRTRSS